MRLSPSMAYRPSRSPSTTGRVLARRVPGCRNTENIDREDYDVIEEATAVQDIARGREREGGGRAAGSHRPMGDSAAQIAQARTGASSGASVGHAGAGGARPALPAAEGQLAALQERQRALAARDRADDARLGAAEEGQPDDGISDRPPRPRRTRIAVAIERLGGTPAAIALSLRAELSLDDRPRSPPNCCARTRRPMLRQINRG